MPESYLRVSVNEVHFNQTDHDNRLELAVHMFGKDDLVPAFVADVEPNLLRLRPGDRGPRR